MGEMDVGVAVTLEAAVGVEILEVVGEVEEVATLGVVEVEGEILGEEEEGVATRGVVEADFNRDIRSSVTGIRKIIHHLF